MMIKRQQNFMDDPRRKTALADDDDWFKVMGQSFEMAFLQVAKREHGKTRKG